MLKGLKIGSGIVIVGLIAFSIFKFFEMRDNLARAEWNLAAKNAEVDTVWVSAEYSIPETVTVSRIRYDTTEGRIDTLLDEIPKISGSIKIDTTKELGPGSNPMSIRVTGQFWYPQEYSNRNWLLIHPIAGTPYLPVTPRSQGKWGIGLTCAMSLDGTGRIGGFARSGRTSLGLYWTPDRKQWMAGLNYEIIP